MDRKTKKKLIHARNRRNQVIFQHARQHQAETDDREIDAAEDEARRKDNPDNAVEDVVFSAKMQKIRNRLTGKKRMAKDRWNRFAGTSGGGGAGR